MKQNPMPIERLQKALLKQRNKQLYRTVDIREGSQGARVAYQGQSYLSFCSNDYLGLANDPVVIKAFQQAATQYGVGSGAAHLLGGHCHVHHALEEALAAFLGYPAALLFSTGYMANMGALQTFAAEGDCLIQDHNNHASLIDGGLLSKANMRRYRHNDLSHLTQILEKNSSHLACIVTQGIFSMSGALSCLPEIVQLAKAHNAWVMIDDAHGIGCLGEGGRGSLEYHGLTSRDVPVLMGTLGKALGSFGAFVAGQKTHIEALRQFARPYIYTTALPPAVCAATLASLKLVQTEPWRRKHLKALTTAFQEGAKSMGLNLLPSVSAIQCIVVGDEGKALQLSQQLLAKNILIKAIRYPTVASGQACLRINFSASHCLEDVEILLDVLRLMT